MSTVTTPPFDLSDSCVSGASGRNGATAHPYAGMWNETACLEERDEEWTQNARG